MDSKKVVITGLGIISPNGNSINDFWDNCINGRSGIDSIKHFDVSSFPTQFGGAVAPFDPLDYMERKVARQMDPFVHYAIAAGQQALQDSNLSQVNIDKLARSRIGILIGSGIGGIQTYTSNDISFNNAGWKRVSPFFIPGIITNMASGMGAIIWGLSGPNYSISTACATSNHAILESMHIIKRGEADIMLAGGSEGALTPLGLAGFCAARALSTRNDDPKGASRPFDKDRDGFVLSEGSGIVVLESEESAIKRGVRVYAEIVGGGMSCDAFHITQPCSDGAGVINCMNMALSNSGVKTDEVNYINTHGTSTPLGDKAEQYAIKQVFGKQVNSIKINSTKSLIGHLLGAAGGAEAIAILKSFETDSLHPTINYNNPDPDCDIDCVPNKAIDYSINVAMSNSFGFGGHNCSIVFRKYSS